MVVIIRLLCVLIVCISTVKGQSHNHRHRKWFSSGRTTIYYGFETTIEEHPYQVNLLNCGGVIIEKKWIITAAHCGSRTHVKVGNAKFIGGTTVRVLKRIEHPKYRADIMDYDFALFELTEDLNYGKTVRPIALAVESDYTPGTLATVTGWGETEQGQMADILRQVSVPLISTEKCKKLYEKSRQVVTDRMVCAGFDEGGKDACVMDSGGPLTANGRLIGITSWGSEECGRADSPGVYAKVSSVRSWIKEVTGI